MSLNSLHTSRTSWLTSLLCATLLLAPPLVLAQHSDKERQVDISRHRAMVAAHEAAAKCLESGKDEEVCMAELRKACKGLAIGKYCGMKHQH